MGLLRRIAGLFGSPQTEEATVGPSHPKGYGRERDKGGRRVGAGARPRGACAGRGFAVQVHAAAERPSLDPVLVPCDLGEGGVQGFRWYTRGLRIDQDEMWQMSSCVRPPLRRPPTENQINPPKFQVTFNTWPTEMAMKNQVRVAEGNVRQRLEYQGELLWV